jgi:hypothetical protein
MILPVALSVATLAWWRQSGQRNVPEGVQA